MLNVDKGNAHVDNKRRKLEQLSVQQIQNARLMSVFLLSYVRRAKSAFGDQNVKLKTLAFLRLHLSATRGPCLFSEIRDPRLYDRTRDSESPRFPNVAG